VRNLLDYLEGGDSLEDFLENFPSVSREQAVVFLEEAGEAWVVGGKRRISSYADAGRIELTSSYLEILRRLRGSG